MSAAGLLVADAAFRLGDWEAADAAALQTFQLAEEVGHRHMAGWALTIRTRILAAQGRSDESRAAAATALAIAESDRISTGLRFVHGALGFLELGLDRIDAAICELETVERMTQGSGHEEPVIVPWVPDLVEAYARQGREATPAACWPGSNARRSVQHQSGGRRARGPLPRSARRRLRRGLRRRARVRRPAAHAVRAGPDAAGVRAPPAPGLAGGRRRASTWRAALEGFERLHAGAWASQAEAELRAAGGRHRPPQDDDGALTPQERRVAAAVRRGASNRDIAADLFLSPKTVEFHLRQIYRKLDVRSRTQLVAALAAERTPRLLGS